MQQLFLRKLWIRIAKHTIILKKNHCTFGSYKFGKGWAFDMLKVPETGAWPNKPALLGEFWI
jgi:hypothetical protein